MEPNRGAPTIPETILNFHQVIRYDSYKLVICNNSAMKLTQYAYETPMAHVGAIAFIVTKRFSKLLDVFGTTASYAETNAHTVQIISDQFEM